MIGCSVTHDNQRTPGAIKIVNTKIVLTTISESFDLDIQDCEIVLDGAKVNLIFPLQQLNIAFEASKIPISKDESTLYITNCDFLCDGLRRYFIAEHERGGSS